MAAIEIGAATRRLYDESLVWDNTLPWVEGFTDDHTLPRFHAAGIDAISLTVNALDGSAVRTVKHIGAVKKYLRDNAETMVQVLSVDDLGRAKAEGKLALMLNLQETDVLEGRLDMIQVYYDLGVRHMLLAYNRKNKVGDGCAERTDGGLSRFGIHVVEEMNRVGMIVDGSHTGYRTSMEAIEVSSAPVIFSHCSAQALYDHYRNIRDDQIKACAASGGVIGMNGMGEFTDDDAAGSETLFRQVDHVAQLVGPAHVSIGLDYVEATEAFWGWVRVDDEAWPWNNGQPHREARFAAPEQIVEVTELMLRAGFGDDDVRGFLGENLIRVAGEVWKAPGRP
jgi:membrane dipeptidase